MPYDLDPTDDRGVKQADVILLGYPQMWPVEREVRRNDLVKYEKVTNVMGPAMTWGMFSIGWLELDQEGKAEELFHRSYRPYVREPFRVGHTHQTMVDVRAVLSLIFLYTSIYSQITARDVSH